MKGQTGILFVALSFIVAYSSCKDMGMAPGTSLEYAETLWRSHNIQSYSIEEERQCFCPAVGKVIVTVVRDSITSVVEKRTGAVLPQSRWSEFKTIDQFFSFIRDVRTRDVAQLEEKYDERFGFPTEVFVDYLASAVDDEVRYRNENLSFRK